MGDASGSPGKPLGVGSMPARSGIAGAAFSPGHLVASRKRKADEASRILGSDTAAVSHLDARSGMQKRPRMDARRGSLTPTQVFLTPQHRSDLPAEIWHRIFTSLPPRALGNLLRVNKLFNTFLDPSSPFVVADQPPRLSQSVAKILEPNEIWKRTRRTFWPNMPGPFQGMTELDMWRLACSSTCQFCGRTDSRTQLPSSDPFQKGPGPDGVARVWEFRVRCCGLCLSRKTIKEMDLIMSTASTFLTPALQFVFATSNNFIIPLHVIESGKLPPSEALVKLFWAPDVDRLREEFASVKEFGAATADEWQKGLSARGSRQRAEIAKWQKYDESGGISSMRTLSYHNHKSSKASPQGPATSQVAASAQKKTSTSKSVSGTTAPAAEKSNTLNTSLSQMVAAEASRDSGVVPAIKREKSADLVSPTGNGKKTKEEIDAEWDEIQGPVRLQILKYADEAIAGDWDDGEKVTKDNAPLFATDVLLHVRKRFYSEVEKSAKAARAAGQQPVIDPPDGPFTQKLSLENMKYVFDVKVKPITGSLRKELFLCNDCGFNGKFFGFEGIVQHFAAKHTTALSQGNIIVHWRAEWPERPPFKASPRPPKTNTQLTLPAKPPSSRNVRFPTERQSLRFDHMGHGSLTGLPQHTGPFPGHATTAAAYSAPQYIPEPPPPPTPPALVPFSQLENYPPSSSPFPPPVHDLSSQIQHHRQPQSQAGLEPYPIYAEQAGHSIPNQTGATKGSEGYHVIPVSHNGTTPIAPSSMRGYQNRGSTADGRGAAGHLAPFYGAGTLTKMDEIAEHSIQLWRATADMHQLPAVVRRHTLHFHLDIFFKQRFNESLPLNLFLDCLLLTKEMHPIRCGNARLHCKACQISPKHRTGATGNKKGYLFRQLIKHFARAHVSYDRNGEVNHASGNWLTDMLILPSPNELARMAGPQGKRFPLLFASIQGLLVGHGGDEGATGQENSGDDERRGSPPSAGGIQEHRAERAERAHEASERGARLASAKGATRPTHGTRHRESSVVIKREESQEPAFPSVHQAPASSSHINSTAPAAPAAPAESVPDILGALEQHLNHGPLQDSLTHHSSANHGGRVPYYEHRESREPLYGARADGQGQQSQRRGEYSDPRHATSTWEDELYARRQTDQADPGIHMSHLQVARDVPPTGQPRASYSTALQPRTMQYRERSPMRAQPHIPEPALASTAHQDDYGIVYGDRGQPHPLQLEQYAHAPPRRTYHDRYSEEDVRAAPARVEYEAHEGFDGYDGYDGYEGCEGYEGYEVVRVVHPDGDYLARRPVRREVLAPVEAVPGRHYYTPAAPQVYVDNDWQQAGRQRYEQGYYAAPAGYARAHPQTFETPDSYAEEPVYSRLERNETAQRDARKRTAAPVIAHPTPAGHSEPLYEEYDPHYPSAAAGQGQGQGQGRAQPAPREDGGQQQLRYQ